MISEKVFLGKMARVKGKLDVVLEEIKALLCGMDIQNNEMMRLMINKKGGVNRGSILGNPMEVLDDMNELKELKQTGALQDYVTAFELLWDKAQLSESQALSCFLDGLNHAIEMEVRMFNPKTLQDAYSLAKLQESLKNNSIVHGHGVGRSCYDKNQGGSTPFQGHRSLTNTVNEDAYALVKLQDSLKNDPSFQGKGARRSYYNMNQGVSTSVQAANPLASNANIGVNKSVVSTTFVKKSLKLTPKQIEGKRKKKLMVLIGTSVHCLCLMICLQMRNDNLEAFLFCRG